MKTKNIPEVYLAGPIQYADDNGHGWRDRVISERDDDFAFLNPLDKYDATENVLWLADGETVPEVAEKYDIDPEGREVISDADIVEGDKEMIQRADALLINIPEPVPMWGTPMEMAFVYSRLNAQRGTYIPIVYCHGDFRPSPWATYHADYVTRDLNDGLDYIHDYYNE